MNKLKQIIAAFSHHTQRLARATVAQLDKGPVITATSALALIAIIGASPLYIHAAVPLFAQLTGKGSHTPTAVKQESTAKVAPISDEKQAPPKPTESTNDEDAVDIEREGVGKITKPTPRCRGAGCPTANPAYSIVIDKSLTVTAGTTIGPFTASTSSGVAVDWTTPGCITNIVCPYAYLKSSPGRSPTMQYFMRAEENVAPGTYTLYMSTIEPVTESIVKTTMTVTVTAPVPPAPIDTPPVTTP